MNNAMKRKTRTFWTIMAFTLFCAYASICCLANGLYIVSGNVLPAPTRVVYMDGSTTNLYLSGAFKGTQIPHPEDAVEVKVSSLQGTVGNYGFTNLVNVTKVSLPRGITKISQYAFINCTSLREVKLSDTITSIDAGAFYNCTNLYGSFRIPNGISVISYGCFTGCKSLTNVVISDSVTNIGQSAFSGCINLSEINISTNITRI